MPCTPFSLKVYDGSTIRGFICTRERRILPCVVCGAPHTRLCDGPNTMEKHCTCSAPLCSRHAYRVGDKDYCPKHNPLKLPMEVASES